MISSNFLLIHNINRKKKSKICLKKKLLLISQTTFFLPYRSTREMSLIVCSGNKLSLRTNAFYI